MNTKIGLFFVLVLIFQTYAQSAFAISLEIYRDTTSLAKSDQTPQI
jgi:hypothetical protein